MRNSFEKGKIWGHPSKTTPKRPKLGGGVIWARGKRRGFSPGAAARYSQYARVYTLFVQKSQKCEFSRLNSKMANKTSETDFGVKNAVEKRI